MMKERRELERFDLRVPAKIGVIHPGREKQTVELLTSNICSNGAFFHTRRPLPEGTQVKVALILPFNKLQILKDQRPQAHVKVTGTVLRTVSTGMAICFNKDYEISPYEFGQNSSATEGGKSATPAEGLVTEEIR